MPAQPRNLYALLYDLKVYRGLDPTSVDDGTDDPLMMSKLYAASRMWEGSTQHKFYPWLQTRYYDFPSRDDRLKVDEPLLEVVTFTTNNGDTEITAAQYFLMTGDSYHFPPYDRISLKSDGTQPNMLYSGTVQRSQAVTAYWGYHEQWDEAWLDSGDSVQDDPSVSAAAVEITVTDADGDNVYGYPRRFKVGQILRITTDDVAEFMEIISIDTDNNKLGVIREVNGTTAAIHLKDTTIEVYLPMGEIARAVQRLAAWLYDQKDAPFSTQIQTSAMGTTITIPPTAPADVIGQAKVYKRFDL